MSDDPMTPGKPPTRDDVRRAAQEERQLSARDQSGISMSGVAGFLVLAMCGLGLFSVVVCIMAIDARQFTGAGLSLIGSAASFGLLLQALFRA